LENKMICLRCSTACWHVRHFGRQLPFWTRRWKCGSKPSITPQRPCARRTCCRRCAYASNSYLSCAPTLHTLSSSLRSFRMLTRRVCLSVIHTHKLEWSYTC